MSLNNTSPEQLHEWAQQLSQDYLPPGWDRAASASYSRVAYNAPLSLFYKEYLPRSPGHRAREFFRGSRASTVQRNTQLLHYYGFNAPPILHRGKLAGGHEYIFMEAAHGANILQWLRELRGSCNQQQGRRRAFLRALGTYVGRLHATGFVHGQLCGEKIFADERPGGFYFTLIDSERIARQLPPAGRNMLRNLSQLNMLPLEDLSETDRMRFFRAWRAQLRHLSNVEARVLAREAARIAMRRVSRSTAD